MFQFINIIIIVFEEMTERLTWRNSVIFNPVIVPRGLKPQDTLYFGSRKE